MMGVKDGKQTVTMEGVVGYTVAQHYARITEMINSMCIDMIKDMKLDIEALIERVDDLEKNDA